MKKIAYTLFLIVSLLLMSGIAHAESTKDYSVGNIEFNVPDDWKYSFGSNGSISYYYPPDGYDESGNVCVFLMADFNYVGSSVTAKEYFDEFENGYANDSSVSIIESKDVIINGIQSRVIQSEQIIDDEIYECEVDLFLSDWWATYFGFVQRKDFKNDILEEFHSIIASVREESDIDEYTRYNSGVYKVGTDIPSGEYILFAQDGYGYFCVSPDSNQDDITFNENFDYNSIITINDGEYLELYSCYAIPVEENPEIDLSGPGMFRVGIDIPAGEYKLAATDDCGYYCIYPDSRQDDIISNDIFENQNYVTVSNGQYLVLSGCKFTEIPEKPVRTYTDPETVKKVQEALNDAGYDCGTPDGIAGIGTKGQIEKYQTDKGLTVTGTITDEVLESLRIQ